MPVARSGEESCQSTRTTRNGTQTLTFLECSVGATHHVKRCSKAPPPNEPPWACGNGTPWCVPETFCENNPKHQVNAGDFDSANAVMSDLQEKLAQSMMGGMGGGAQRR